MNRPPPSPRWRPLRLEDLMELPEVPPELPLIQESVRRWLPSAPSASLNALGGLLQRHLTPPVRVCLQPLTIMDGEATSALAAGGWRAMVHGPGSLHSLLTLDLRLSLAMIDALLERPPSAARRLRPLSPMESGLLDAQMDLLLQQLPTALGVQTTLQLQTNDAQLRSWAPRRRMLTLIIEVHVGDASGLLHWRVATADWLALPTPDAHSPLQLPHGAVRWPIALKLHLGSFPISSDALQRMEPGGLLLGTLNPQPSFHLTLTHEGRACVHARFEVTSSGQGELTVISERDHRQEDTMNSGDALDPGELPVTVHLEWGTVNLTVARCAGLTSGDVLPLEDALTRPVTLRAGAQTLAQAELVRVGEALGLRIVSVTKAASPSSADQ